MATALTPTSLNRAALVEIGTPAAADPTGNTVPNSGVSFLYIENTANAERTITVAFARGVDGVLPQPREFTIDAEFTGFLRLGSPADYGAVVTVTASANDVLLKAFQL